MRLFLDANVFLYAVGREHALREPCRRILERVGSGELEAVTSAEVLQEFLHVLHRRGLGPKGVALCRHLIALFPDLLDLSRRDLVRSCDLLESTDGITARDAVHAAVAMRAECAGIVSADAHFDRIAGLRRIDPAELGADG